MNVDLRLLEGYQENINKMILPVVKLFLMYSRAQFYMVFLRMEFTDIKFLILYKTIPFFDVHITLHYFRFSLVRGPTVIRLSYLDFYFCVFHLFISYKESSENYVDKMRQVDGQGYVYHRSCDMLKCAQNCSKM